MSKSAELLQKLGEHNLIEWLQINYNLSIKRVVSIPVGVSGSNYSIEDQDGKKYFLKLHLRKNVEDAEGLENTLNLTAQLHERGIANIPYAIRSAEQRVDETWGDYVVVVTNYIEGGSLDEKSLSDSLLQQLGVTLCKIHQTNVEGIMLPVEPVDLSYALKLRSQLEFLQNGEEPKKYVGKLRELLLPRLALLSQHLQTLEQLSEQVKASAGENVITHGDLIPDNLMLNDDGKLFIVDWDTAQLAPPERDVWFFMKNKTFLEGYRESNPKMQLNMERLAFYMYKRYIEDMVYWANQILHENTTDEQNETDLEGIRVCCIERYKDIDEQIEKARQLLEHYPVLESQKFKLK